MAIGNLLEDLRQGELDQRSWMQLNHRVHVHPFKHVVEIAAIVVDDGPAASPAGQAVDLGERTGANDGNSARRFAN